MDYENQKELSFSKEYTEKLDEVTAFVSTRREGELLVEWIMREMYCFRSERAILELSNETRNLEMLKNDGDDIYHREKAGKGVSGLYAVGTYRVQNRYQYEQSGQG